jgi:hypothetical protein
LIVGPVAAGEEEPQSVFHDRAADAVVDIVLAVELAGNADALRLLRIVDVLALQRLDGAEEHLVAAELVAAGARDPVDDHAAELILGRPAADLHGDFLRLHLVVVNAGALAGSHHPVDDHPVDQGSRISRRRTVHGQGAAGPHRRRAADVEAGG